MVRARSAVVASLLVAGVILAGCGGPQEPKPLEGQQNAQDNAPDDAGGDQGDDSGDEGSSNGDDSTPSDQGTGGANHGPAQGMDYEPVDKQTEAQVEKVALKFSSEYDKLLAGEPSTVKKLYTDACKQCSEYVGNVEDTYQRGGRYEGGGYLAPRVEVRGRDDAGRVFAVLVSKSSAYKLYDGSGRVVETEPEKQDNQRYYLEETAAGWRIVQWT